MPFGKRRMSFCVLYILRNELSDTFNIFIPLNDTEVEQFICSFEGNVNFLFYDNYNLESYFISKCHKIYQTFGIWR